jgi:hypothetical protein
VIFNPSKLPRFRQRGVILWKTGQAKYPYWRLFVMGCGARKKMPLFGSLMPCVGWYGMLRNNSVGRRRYWQQSGNMGRNKALKKKNPRG